MKKALPLFIAALLSTAATPALAFKCIPIYGNWCGTGHPRIGDFPPPMDGFDAACMRHDFCTNSPGSDRPCDITFVQELRGLAIIYGHLPRPLQWAEYAIRIKAGGNPLSDMPMPSPFDAMGLLGSMATPCW